MNDQLYNVIIPLLITILPVAVISYRDDKISISKATIWGVLSFLISMLVLYLVKTKYYFIHIIITVILSTLFNYGVIKKSIDIKKIPKLLLVFVLFFFSSLFQLIPIYLFNLNLDNLSASHETLLTLFSNSILLIIIFFLYRKEIIEQFKAFKKNLYSYLDTGFKYWLIGLIVMVVSNLLIASFFPNAIAGNEEQVQDLIHGAPLISFICVGILAPIIEEFTFRKAFFDAFKNKWLYVFVSGIVFGGLHVVLSFTSLLDFVYLIPYCSLGIAFGFIMVKTENIFPSICVHMFHNTCLTLLSIIGTSMVIL